MSARKDQSRDLTKLPHDLRTIRLHQLLKSAAMPLLFLLLTVQLPAQSALDGFDPNAKGPIRVTAAQPEAKILAGDGFFPFGGTGTWSVTGSLANGRYFHTATLLSSGRVLVAGGTSNSGPSASAELYDPASGTWSATSDLPHSRKEHTAVLLPDGKVLVAGGAGGRNLDRLVTAELYDPSSGTWSTTGSIAARRMDHTMTLLPNGKVLIAGGLFSFALNSAEVYDPASGTWSATGGLAVARYHHTATLLPNGTVLVTGGYSDAGGYQASAELFDPATGTWSPTGSLGVARLSHTATLLPNGKVLIAGGGYDNVNAPSAELYDPASGTWSTTGSLITARSFHAMTLLPTGHVLVAGGFANAPLSSAELYDPASGTWSVTGSFAPARYWHTLTVQPNGTVLSVGGLTAMGPTHAGDLYDIGPLPTPGTLGNISTRLRVLSGDNALIGGMIATGTAGKRVIIRAIGPSLLLFGIPGALANPTLDLFQGSTLLFSNDDWNTSSQQAEITNSGLAPSNALEAAIIWTLTPGQSYTAVVRGQSEGTGVGIVEAYDLDQAAASKLGNISTRGFVDVDDNVMIAGLIAGPGNGTSLKILVRALGPTLADFGVPGALTNPTLDLVNSSGTLIRSNNDWRDDPQQQAAIEAAGLAPSHNVEAALVETVAPGAYTAVVRGNNRTTGVGLVELYHIP